jgi:hypothetical protein
MLDIVESPPPLPPWKKYLAYGALGAGALTLAATIYHTETRPHDDGMVYPEYHAKPRPPTVLYEPLGTDGTEIVFSKNGSQIIKTNVSGNITMIDEQRKSRTHFDTVRCENGELHGGMVSTAEDPTTSEIVIDMVLPENNLSEMCRNGKPLPAAQIGKLIILGHAYDYELAK